MADLRILLVEDDPDIREAVTAGLREAGHDLTVARDGGEAVEALDGGAFDLVLTDVRLPGAIDGLAIFRRVRETTPSTDVILMTSFASVQDAVAALKAGARDYLTKPFDVDELAVRVAGIGERRALARQLSAARAELAASKESPIVGSSSAMRRLLDRVATVAASDAAVVVTGESGTGKELVARRIHAMSPRRGGPFIAVNCAAFPEGLVEAELFGHERGAFTGASRRREGRFKAADGGTLLLDEVAELPLPAQAKLLRVLQEGAVEPLGTNASIRVDVRIVSATHRDLRKRIAEGSFREDLYYRLNVVELHIPPLRERPEDLPLLVAHFLRLYTPADRPVPEVTLGAWQTLAAYPFLGNVRELAHAVQHAVVLSRGEPIETDHLPGDLVRFGSAAARDPERLRPLAAVVKQAEREHLLRALAITSGQRTRAAELLGISRKNLWEKLQAHGITDSDLDD